MILTDVFDMSWVHEAFVFNSRFNVLTVGCVILLLGSSGDFFVCRGVLALDCEGLRLEPHIVFSLIISKKVTPLFADLLLHVPPFVLISSGTLPSSLDI